MAPTKSAFNNIEVQTRARLLLALWDLGGIKQEVKKGELSKRIVPKGKKVADYQEIFEELEKEQAISKSKKGYSLVSPKGLEVLGESLNSADFRFKGSTVSAWTANALLKWISEMNCGTSSSNDDCATNSEHITKKTLTKGKITSFHEFKQVVLQVYEQLNRDYNLDNLVPIYRIRRNIGDRVTREQFNEWLLEMQGEDILQLQGGSLPDNDSAKIEDSITTPVNGLRCYAKLLNL